MTDRRDEEQRLRRLIDSLMLRHTGIDQEDRPDMEATQLKLSIRHLNNAVGYLYNADEIRQARKERERAYDR